MHLLITVRFAEGRFHGQRDWPPSPWRLFQALIAGAGLGGPLSDGDRKTFRWIETLEPPLIAGPEAQPGKPVVFFVPRNDLDAVNGDPDRIEDIRYPKTMQPQLFDEGVPLLYAWSFDENEGQSRANDVCALAANLYRLGHGIDIAWATGEVVDEETLNSRLSLRGIRVFTASDGRGGLILACPQEGSFDNLENRFQGQRLRFETHKRGRARVTVLSKADRPRFTHVAYNAQPWRRVYELREPEGAFVSWPLQRAASLVATLRGAAAKKLNSALPNRAAEIKAALEGQVESERKATPLVNVIPLASIGHPYADFQVRRVLVEVHPNCRLTRGDLDWTFSDLEIEWNDGRLRALLTPSESGDAERMMRHYGSQQGSRVWWTVTPMVLTARRRIEPTRKREEAKGGNERAEELRVGGETVLRALVQAKIGAKVEAVRVQQEPFLARGARSEAFATGSGFPKERLWHVGITFVESVQGPLLLGDGRFHGLGVMAPGVEDGFRAAAPGDGNGKLSATV